MSLIGIPENLLFYKYRPGLVPSKDDESGIKLLNRDLEIITKNRVWFDNPSNFNDPFDCAPAPSQRTPEEIESVLQRVINNTNNISITDAQRLEVKNKYESDPEEAIKIIDYLSSRPEYVTAFMSGYIVYCLAKNPLIRLMWSHYANNHAGFAVEFDVTKNLNKDPRLRTDEEFETELGPLPVIYQRERPTMHDKSNGNQAEVLLIKDCVWGYEEEFRVVKQGQPSLVEFDPDYLKSVILGAKVTPDTKAIIQDAVFDFNREHQTDMKIYYAELSKTKYELVIPNHPVYENRS